MEHVRTGQIRVIPRVRIHLGQRKTTFPNCLQANLSGTLSKLAVLEAAMGSEPLATEHVPVGGSAVSLRPHVNDANHRAVKYCERMHATVPAIMMRRTCPGTRASVWQPSL